MKQSWHLIYVKVYEVYLLFHVNSSVFIAMVEGFQATHISDTTVRVTWQQIVFDAVDRYTVYYYSTSEVKRQVDSGSKNFPANVSEGVIDGLDPILMTLVL